MKKQIKTVSLEDLLLQVKIAEIREAMIKQNHSLYGL